MKQLISFTILTLLIIAGPASAQVDMDFSAVAAWVTAITAGVVIMGNAKLGVNIARWAWNKGASLFGR